MENGIVTFCAKSKLKHNATGRGYYKTGQLELDEPAFVAELEKQ